MKPNYRLLVVLFVVAALAVAWAQGPRGRAQSAPGNGQGQPALDMTKLVTVEGPVSAIQLNYGAQYPTIEVNKTLIKIAPVWFLIENDFEIDVNDVVKVTAALSTADAYLHAVEIVNVTNSNALITLRDKSGTPLWTTRQAGRAGRWSQDRMLRGNGGGQACLDMASGTTVSGIVSQVTMGTGIKQPVVVIEQADKSLISVKIGPERILLENDVELTAGEAVTAKIAKSACKDEWVALELTVDGKTVVLRTELGAPAWN